MRIGLLRLIRVAIRLNYFLTHKRLSLSIDARNWFGPSNGSRKAYGVGGIAFLPLVGQPARPPPPLRLLRDPTCDRGWLLFVSGCRNSRPDRAARRSHEHRFRQLMQPEAWSTPVRPNSPTTRRRTMLPKSRQPRLASNIGFFTIRLFSRCFVLFSPVYLTSWRFWPSRPRLLPPI